MMCGLAFHPERTFTLGAANGSCEPELTNTASNSDVCFDVTAVSELPYNKMLYWVPKEFTYFDRIPLRGCSRMAQKPVNRAVVLIQHIW